MTKGKLQVTPSDQSIDVDVSSSVKAIAAALVAGEHDVPLTITREDPAISDAQAQDALLQAQAYVQNGLTLTWSDGSAQLGPADLIAALTVESHPGTNQPIVVGLSAEVVAQLLGPVSEQVNIQANNGRFRLVDNKIKLEEKGSNGRQVDVDTSSKAIIAAVTGGEPTVELTVTTVKPKYSSSTAKKIKLDDVLGTASTYYGNSSDARRRKHRAGRSVGNRMARRARRCLLLL